MIRSCRTLCIQHPRKKQVSVHCLLRRQSHIVTVLLTLNGLPHIRRLLFFLTNMRRHSLQCSSVLNAAKMWRCGWQEMLLHQLHLQSAYTLLCFTHFQTFIDLLDWFSGQHERQSLIFFFSVFFVLFCFFKEIDTFQNQDLSINRRPAS